MGNRRVLPPALKDAYTVPLKRNNVGRVDATTRSFHGVSGGCCDIIPSVYTARNEREREHGLGRAAAATHARTRVRPRPAAQRATPVQPELKHHLSKPVRRNAEPLARSARALTGTYTHPREHARKVQAEARAVGGRFDVAAGLLPSPTRIPLYTSRAPLFLSSLSPSLRFFLR